MSFCTKCGKQNSDTAKFCTGCGISLLIPKPAPVTIADNKNIDIGQEVKESSMLLIKKNKSLNRIVILTFALIVLIIVCLSFF